MSEKAEKNTFSEACEVIAQNLFAKEKEVKNYLMDQSPYESNRKASNDLAAFESFTADLKEPDSLKLIAEKVLEKVNGSKWFDDINHEMTINELTNRSIAQNEDEGALVQLKKCNKVSMEEQINEESELPTFSAGLIGSTGPSHESTRLSGIESYFDASVTPINLNEPFTDIAETDTKYTEDGYYECYKIQHKADEYDLKLTSFDSSGSSDYQSAHTCSSEDE